MPSARFHLWMLGRQAYPLTSPLLKALRLTLASGSMDSSSSLPPLLASLLWGDPAPELALAGVGGGGCSAGAFFCTTPCSWNKPRQAGGSGPDAGPS